MPFDFPNNPTANQAVVAPNGGTFVWDGAKWTTGAGPTPVLFLPLSGGVMQGLITLSGNATQPLHAVPLQQLNSVMAGSLNYAATGTPTIRSAQDRAAQVINVKDYGAKGDGVTDDSAAINAALQVARNIHNTTGAGWTLVFPGATYLVKSPLNFTGFRVCVQGQNIEGQGSLIIGAVPGGIVVDCTDSRWMHFHDLTIQGDATHVPKIGMQLGPTASHAADYITLTRTNIFGSFAFTSFYNKGSEAFSAYSCYMGNDTTGLNAYVMVLDGINHWNASSSFGPITQPVETRQTFKGHLFDDCAWQGVGSTGVIWMANPEGVRMASCYASNTTANSRIFSLYSIGDGSPAFNSLDLDIHCETTALAHTFVVTAPSGITNWWGIGLKHSDIESSAQTSLFAIDSASAIATAALVDLDLWVQSTYGGTTVLVDTPSKWEIWAHRLSISRCYYQDGFAYLSGPFTDLTNQGTVRLSDAQKVGAADGGSVTVNQNGAEVYLLPSAPIAGFTVTMPPAAIDGQEVRISTIQDITTLTVAPNTGQYVGYQPGTLFNNQAVTYRWEALTACWYCLSTPQSVGVFTLLYATGFSTGSDGNGAIALGNASVAVTPYIDFLSQGSGTPGMRVISTGQNIYFMPGAAGAGALVIDNTGLNLPGSAEVIDFNSTSFSPPSFNTRSTGTKLSLYSGVSGTTTDIAIGVEANAMWFSGSTTTTSFKWYGGITLAAALTGAGALTLAGGLTCVGGAFTGTFTGAHTYSGAVTHSGSLICTGSQSLTLPAAAKTGTAYTVATTDCSLILNPSGTFTLTLPAAASNTGRVIRLKLVAAFAVNSASSNVVQITGGAATVAIMTATVGKFCLLQSDGASWQIMQAN